MWFVVSPVGEAVSVMPPTPTVMVHATTTPTPAELAPEGSPTITPPGPIESPTPDLPTAVGQPPTVQEIATLENYAASQFFPPTLIVIKDIPLNLLMTRLHREHVNQFTIEPFVSGRPFARPGTVATVAFTPDQSGQFKMRNVGHFFEGDFIVVESAADAKSLVSQMGMQEFSLIHDLETGSTSPSRTVIQIDIPVRVHNTSLKGDGRVSIEPFYKSEEVNVKQKKITTFEFVPDVAGEFAITDGNGIVIGTLVIE